MVILNKDFLPNHGPYINFVRQKTKLVFPKWSWPAPELYEKNIVFNMADDLLGCICSFTGKHCPFDPYELIQLSGLRKPMEFAGIFLAWAMDVMRGDAAKAMHSFRYLNYFEGRKELTGQDIKLDVSETLIHMAHLALDAAKKREYLIIVGI